MNASDEDRVKDLDEQSYLSGYNHGMPICWLQ